MRGLPEMRADLPPGDPILKLYEYANREYIRNQKFTMRAGRGPVLDTEIRKVGAPLVLGQDPGSYSAGRMLELPQLAPRSATTSPRSSWTERLHRRCHGLHGHGHVPVQGQEDGKTIWEQYEGGFDGRNICNIGSCVSDGTSMGQQSRWQPSSLTEAGVRLLMILQTTSCPRLAHAAWPGEHTPRRQHPLPLASTG